MTAEIEAAETAGDDPAARPSISLLPGHARRAEAGHPWIFSNEVKMDAAAKALPPGGLVTLCRAGGSSLGVAMFNPHTLLAARLLDRDAGSSPAVSAAASSAVMLHLALPRAVAVVIAARGARSSIG